MAYRGQTVKLPIGTLGLSGSRNPTQLQAGHFQAVEGVSLHGGLIQKEGGATKMNTDALGAGAVVVSGINYSPLTGATRDAVFLSDGQVLKDSGTNTFPTVMAFGLVSVREPPPYFMMAGGEAPGQTRDLFLFSTTNQVQISVGDAGTMAAIGTPAADWTGAGNFPPFGVLHEHRIWAGGNATDPHRIYYSTATDHGNYTGAGSGTISIYPGEGERLVGGVSFKGLLVLWKYPKGIYVVTTTDPTPANWRVDRLSSAVGGVNQQSLVPIDNDIMYLDQGGNIHLISATEVTGGVQTSNISQVSEMSEFMRTNVNLAAIRRSCGIWYGPKQEAWFAFPGTGATDNNTRITINMKDPQNPIRFLSSLRDIPISMWMRPDATTTYKPAHGDNAGFVWNMDRDTRNKDGVAYRMAFQSAHMDLAFADPALATKAKTGDFLEITYEPQGDWDLLVTVYWDDVLTTTILFSMGSQGSPLGVFTLGEHMLTTSSIRSSRRRIAGSGRRIQVVASNEGLDQNVAISDIYLAFRTTDERSE